MRIASRGMTSGRVALAALAALTLTAGDAQGAVSCGKVVKKDLKLKKNLKNCPGDGLVVGASGITIDLNGHTVSGTKAGGSSGIEFAFAYSNVLVKGGGGGRIARFADGVATTNGSNKCRVRGVRIKNTTGSAVRVTGCDNAKVHNNDIEDGGVYSVSVTLSENVGITGNEITVPAPDPSSTAGVLIAADPSGANSVEDNVIRGAHEGTWGILVHGSAPGGKLKGNVVRGFTQFGIGAYNGVNTTAVKKNVVAGNGTHGIHIQNTAGTGTKVVKNTARDNGFDGIRLDKASQVGDNRANDNGSWGIVAVAGSTDLGGNKASGNGQAAQCSGVGCS
jgi:parallel beta-helix repeat protein